MALSKETTWWQLVRQVAPIYTGVARKICIPPKVASGRTSLASVVDCEPNHWGDIQF